MSLILGSQSPRRKEILSFFQLPFKQVSPNFDEDLIPFQGDPKTYVGMLAKGKGDSLVSQLPSSVIITADTVVYKKGRIYGKPANEQMAIEYLRELSGTWHQVWTGVSVHSGGQCFQAAEETRVLFNDLSEEQIQIYARLDIADKAGGYMIQGPGSLIVKRIEGCYYNVVGLPINALAKVLQQAGIDLWQHLKSAK